MNAGAKKRGQLARRRARAWEGQEGLCHLCGGLMMQPHIRRGQLAATWDHVIARSAGGSNHQTNLMLAHRLCNQQRGCMGAEEYRAELTCQGVGAISPVMCGLCPRRFSTEAAMRQHVRDSHGAGSKKEVC